MAGRPLAIGFVLLAGLAVGQTRGTQQSDPGSAAADQTGVHTVGPGDVLRITVFEEPDLSGLFPVDSTGSFSYPLLGRIDARRPASAIGARLEELLSGDYLIDPSVSVEVESYRVRTVYVLGEVRNPGAYELGANMSLLEILAAAGSTTPEASDEVQILSRVADAGLEGTAGVAQEPRVRAVDLAALRDGELQVSVRDGDTIHVPRLERFFVTGHVRSPGAFVWHPGITVLQAISLAGGLTERGSDRGIKIVRSVDGKPREIAVRLEDSLQAGDTIKVRRRFF